MGILSLLGFNKRISDQFSDLLETAGQSSFNMTESLGYVSGNVSQTALSLGGNVSSVISSCSFYSQIGLAGVGLSQCICSSIDACLCINPIAKPLYVVSAISSGLGAISSLGCCTASMVAPAFVPVLMTSGIACRFGAKYATKVALIANPCPSLSEIV